jgi:IS30 family transposase
VKTLKLHHAPKQHFTEEKRIILQRLWNVNANLGRETRLGIRAFAKRHGVPYETLRRELGRGMAGKPLFDEIKREWFYPEYCAEEAQSDAAWKNARKGTAQRITNKHAAALRHHIVTLGKSPNHALHDMRGEGHEKLPCLRTVYNHIDHGDIGVLRGQTPYRPGAKRKRRPPVARARKCPGNTSIEQRPPEVGARADFGHWEMDSLVSKVGGRGGLLALVERSTRFVFAVRLRSITAKAVRNALRGIIKSGALGNIRSITTDNGCEFLDSDALKRLFRQVNAMLEIYYTHAYAAWEKGTVENANRHIRRFFPKGTDFSRVKDSRIMEMQNFINSIPRKNTLNGKSAQEAFNQAA